MPKNTSNQLVALFAAIILGVPICFIAGYCCSRTYLENYRIEVFISILYVFWLSIFFTDKESE